MLPDRAENIRFYLRLAGLASVLAVGLAACRPADRAPAPLLTLLPPDSTGITFSNNIVEDDGFNVLEYEYFFNGGGVAAGDVNGDGLPDLFFTANMGPDRLYINQGGFRFEDRTEAAGIQPTPSWTTGVTMADVNGDGWLDVYVCRSGRVQEDRRRNALYLNNGDGTFTDRAADYGLDDPAYSTHATFFDYDRDGDLDLYLLNHPIRRFASFDVDLIKQQRDPLAGDKLYRNDTGAASGTGSPTFVDVSAQAGIIQNPLGFGLSAQVSDINGDGWPDLYVANDYIEDDYLYLNNGDGTFTESIRAFLTHTSYSSMGTDVADVNNDAWPDIVTLDMLAEDPRRLKQLKGPESRAAYRQMRERGFHEQYMRNMLHLSQGPGRYAEVGQLAGVGNTDWSWAPLLVDFDLDGRKDLFVSNGYLRDYTDLDFLSATLAQAQEEARRRGVALSSKALIERMPSTPLRNYLFRNTDGLLFDNVTDAWGLGPAGFSGGAAYADLDADGDPDLVVSNTNAPAAVYRNEADRTAARFLRVRLAGTGANTYGIGAKVTLTTPDGRTFFQEQVPARGYQSAVTPVLLFGLGAAAEVDVAVTWPDGRYQALSAVAADQTLVLQQDDAAAAAPPPPPPPRPYFAAAGAQGLGFVHRENPFDDYDREPLLPHQHSRLGPALAVGDANRDGLDDVFVGGAHEQAAQLFLQQADGTFAPLAVDAFEQDRAAEDVDALFFDADGDGDLDLYVVSGGSFAEGEGVAYQDRLYRNSGFGGFAAAPDALPEIVGSGATVAAHDIDADGDLDLFVGGRVLPGRYPMPPRSYLLVNQGGRFADATPEALQRPGLITEAAWADLDGDQRAELILAGAWMPVRIFALAPDRTLEERTAAAGLGAHAGWWNAVLPLDLDGDGDLDLVAGNRGLNAQMQAPPGQPARIHAADLDRNGSVDAIQSYYRGGASHPVPTRDELIGQVPRLATRFPTYAAYASATMDDVLTPEEAARALVLEAHTFATSIFENQGDGTFLVRPLPAAAQAAPVRTIVAGDVDGDGRPDLLVAGNDFTVRPQWGRQNSGRGLLLMNRGGDGFEPASAARSGFWLPGDVRRMATVRTRQGIVLVVASNDAPLAVFAPQ